MATKLAKGITSKVKKTRVYLTQNGKEFTSAAKANGEQKRVTALHNVRKVLIDYGLNYSSNPSMMSSPRLTEALLDRGFLNDIKKAAFGRSKRRAKKKA